MTESVNTKDKVIFSVSYLTVLVTIMISGYKEILSQTMISIFFHSFSIFDLLIYVFIFLFLSVYLSATESLQNSKIKIPLFLLNICSYLSDIFYFIAIIALPATIIVSYFTSIFLYASIDFLNYININTPLKNSYVDIITGIISIIFGAFIVKVSKVER